MSESRKSTIKVEENRKKGTNYSGTYATCQYILLTPSIKVMATLITSVRSVSVCLYAIDQKFKSQGTMYIT